MLWLFFALVSVVALSVATLLQRILLKDQDSNVHAYSIAFQLTCGVLVMLYALIHGFSLPELFAMPVNFIIEGVLYGFGTWFLFQALRLSEASEVTIVTSIRAVVTVISAMVFLSEPFGYAHAIGVLLILVAIVLVSWHGQGITFTKGTYFSIAMAFCYGLAVTNDAFILKTADTLSYTAVSFLLPGIFLILVKPSTLRKASLFLHGTLFWRMLIMCLIYSTAAISFYLALSAGAPASQIGPINQFSVILTVLLAALFLNERDNLWKKALAAMLAIVGVILLA